MKVGELIETLKEFPEDLAVILSSDEEGNSFRHLSDIGDYLYDPENDYYVEEIWDEEDEAPEGCIRGIILWP